MTHDVLARSALDARGRAGTLLALARADARRFARHPLFLIPCAVVAWCPVVGPGRRDRRRDQPDGGHVTIAFFIGVFGFVVAHRLTTSLLPDPRAGRAPSRSSSRAHPVPVPGLPRPGGGGLVAAGFMLVANAMCAARRRSRPACRCPGSATTRPRRPRGAARDGTAGRPWGTAAGRGRRPLGAVPRLGTARRGRSWWSRPRSRRSDESGSRARIVVGVAGAGRRARRGRQGGQLDLRAQ